MEPTPATVLYAPPSRTPRRRRFLALSVAVLALAAAGLGVSFTADTGVTTVAVTAGSAAGNLVYPATVGGAVIDGVTALKYTPAGDGTGIDAATDLYDAVTTPGWSPITNTAGSVGTAGDLALIDAKTDSAGGAANLIINVYITNLAAMQTAYSSFAFPIRLYTSTNGSTWTEDTAYSNLYITNTSGFASFTVSTAPTKYADITMDTGGSFYCVNQAGTLSPAFYFTVTPA